MMFLPFFFLIASFAFANENQNCLDEMGRRWATLEMTIADGSLPAVSQSQGGETIYLNGKIDAAMASEFKKKVRALGPKVKFLVINSPGGNVGAGEEIADWVFERGPNLKVSVPYNGICASMCTHIMQCADQTSADQSALFMHHPASLTPEGRSGLEQVLKKGPLANLAASVIEGLATNSLNNNKCAKSYQSEGARKTAAATQRGLEICFSAAKIDKEYKGLINSTDRTDAGLLDAPAGR